MTDTRKSTIARTAAQSFVDQDQLRVSFFFKKDERERDNVIRFFITIVIDLMSRVSRMISSVRKAIDADLVIFEKTLKDQFEKLILQSLLEEKRVSQKALRLIVVVDALDECEREKNVRAILQLFSRTKNISSVSLRIFITSRSKLSIRLDFK